MSYNIFVIFTRYQFQCVQDIIQSKNIENTLLITTIPISAKEFEGEIHYFEKITSLKSLFDEIYNKKRKKAFLQIKTTSMSYQNINVYIPHYFNIHSNYIATSLFSNVQIHIFPDGILSFYPYQLTKKDILRQFVNKIVALSIGLKYKLFFSNIIDPFQNINDIYSYDPKMTYSYGKEVHQITYIKKNIHIDKSTKRMIILGTFSKLDNELETIEKILNFIKENEITKIYYKMHPSRTSDSIFVVLSDSILNLTLLTEQTGAEMLIEKYSINTVVSVEFSTALLEMQRLYDHQLDCHINNTAIVKNSKYKDYFEKLLNCYQIKEFK